MNERKPSDAIRAFGEAYRRKAPQRMSPELVEAIGALARSLRESADRFSRVAAQMADSVKDVNRKV